MAPEWSPRKVFRRSASSSKLLSSSSPSSPPASPSSSPRFLRKRHSTFVSKPPAFGAMGDALDEQRAAEQRAAELHEPTAVEAKPDTPGPVDRGNLFYAYARRTDHASFSRYILTFLNADVARQWWAIVHDEYPEAIREGTQLFSFTGDNFPGRAWANPKLEHLKTKWFYSQFGDAVGMGGRHQEILPLQDEKGRLVSPRPATRQGLGEPFGVEETEVVGGKSLDLSLLSDHLTQVQSMIEQSASQVKALSEGQAESTAQIRALAEAQMETASQVQVLSSAQSNSMDRLQSLVGGNTAQIKHLAEKPAIEAAKETLRLDQIQLILAANAHQIKSLTMGQENLVAACREMLKVIERSQRQPSPKPPPPADPMRAPTPPISVPSPLPLPPQPQLKVEPPPQRQDPGPSPPNSGKSTASTPVLKPSTTLTPTPKAMKRKSAPVNGLSGMSPAQTVNGATKAPAPRKPRKLRVSIYDSEGNPTGFRYPDYKKDDRRDSAMSR